MTRRMRLAELLPDVAGVPEDLEIAGLVQDSRAIRAGDAFVAIAGFGAHGLKFVAQAEAAGASAILFEPPLPDEFAARVSSDVPMSAVPMIAVPDLRARLGAIADAFHGAPTRAMTTVGVTGTNGKTSTVQLLAQAWTLRGRRAGTIGTLGAGLYGEAVPTGFTTPLVLQLHALLADLRDQGADAVAMEVSSHALDQGRVDGVHFGVGVFTNLTRDHLDYHGTMDAYGAAKAKLFAWPGLDAAVINLDDAFGGTLHAALPASVRAVGVSSRGHAAAAVRAEDIALDIAGIRFTLCIGETRLAVRSPLLGRFYVDNLLAVAGTLHALGEAPADIADLLSRLHPVNGRMNRLGGEHGQPLVVVDYGKRPQMAAIAEAQADAVIVTDDNPRTEHGDAIVADILAGFSRPDAIVVRRDRAVAIAEAIRIAAGGDIVLIAGKGHEPYQEIDGVQHPFDDTATARAVLELRA
jgi:UDP-N-acetylmuramoyl-L-alanyl-D-glutamate--2,6-diaminopimelate ligase